MNQLLSPALAQSQMDRRLLEAEARRRARLASPRTASSLGRGPFRWRRDEE